MYHLTLFVGVHEVPCYPINSFPNPITSLTYKPEGTRITHLSKIFITIHHISQMTCQILVINTVYEKNLDVLFA